MLDLSNISHKRVLPLLMLHVFLFAIATGINIISMPYVLYGMGVPPSLMGISSATEIFAGILIARFLPDWGKKIGLFRLIVCFTAINLTVVLIISFYQNLFFWLILVFIYGMSWFCIVALRQSWINNVANDYERAVVIGITSTIMCLGLTLGPLIIKYFGTGNYPNFIISAICILLSCLALFPIRTTHPRIEKVASEAQIFNIIKKDYQIYLARFLSDFQGSILVIFTVTYGINYGYSPENSGLLVSAYMVIGALDFLIGILVNNKPFKKYLILAYKGCLITILILPLVIKIYSLTILIYIIFGWFISLIFITTMTAANNKQKKEYLVAVNSTLQLSGSLGSFTGILFAGILIQTLGKHGFVIGIALSSLIFLITNFFIRTKNEKNPLRS